MITPQTLKGFRDFSPKEAIARQYVIDRLREVFESYGYDPIQTPAIEYLETFAGSIGEDEKLFYKWEDHGGREIALRYDQTVPTCRYVAEHRHEITLPFKRYQIDRVWRADKPQKGRYREFIQCDFDIFGVAGPLADAETIAITIDSYLKMGIDDFCVHISDRKLYEGIDYPVIAAMDKLDKIGRDGVRAEIIKKGYSEGKADEMLERVFSLKPNQTIEAIFDYLQKAGFDSKHYTFDNTLARSFSYSDGPIWEVKVESWSGGSIGGGERYDALINRFTKEQIPATGIAIGFDRTMDLLLERGLIPTRQTGAEVLVTVFGPETLEASLQLSRRLREAGFRVDTYTDPSTKLGKQLAYADKKGIPYALIVGPDEVTTHQVVLRPMQEQGQQTLSIEALIDQLRGLLR